MLPVANWQHVSLRLQLREEDHVADAFLAKEHHAQAVNADAARRGQAVFEGDEGETPYAPPKCFSTSLCTAGRFTNAPGVSTFTP